MFVDVDEWPGSPRGGEDEIAGFVARLRLCSDAARLKPSAPRADCACVDELAPQPVSAPVPPGIDDGIRAARRGNELLTPGVRLYLLVGIAALAAFYAMPYDTLFQDTIYYPAI